MLRRLLAVGLLAAIGSAGSTAGASPSPSSPCTTSWCAYGPPITYTYSQTSPSVGSETLIAGTLYRLVVSGTLTNSTSVGAYTYDALYCIANTVTSYGCFLSPGKRDRSAAILVGTNVHALGPIDAFEQPNAHPKACPSCDGPQTYNANNTYKVPFYPTQTGVLRAGTLDAFSHYSKPDYTSGYITIQVETKAAAPPAVSTLSNIHGKVEIQRNGGAWEPISSNSMLTLKPGDRIHTGYKAGVTLTFPDTSTMTVDPMSLVVIDDINTAVTPTKVRTFVRLGDVSADVNRRNVAASDFQVRTPTTTTSSRGTKFSVFTDGTRTVVSVTKDSVLVTPNRGRATVIPQGKEAGSTTTGVGPIVAIGKADAPPGSVGPAAAVALVGTAISSGIAACRDNVWQAGLKPLAHGWTVALQLTGPKPGNGIWTISQQKVAATSHLAKSIAAGCK